MTAELHKPNPITTFSIQDFAGDVCLVIMGGYHERFPTKEYGVKPASSVTIIMLSGKNAETIFDDVLLFGKQGGQFRDRAGGDFALCRIVPKGRTAVFDEASAYDEAMCLQWMTANPAKLEALRADAVRSFRAKAADLAAQPQGSLPAGGEPSPQWKPQPTTPADQPLPGMPAEPSWPGPEATGIRDSLRGERVPADPQETGY